MSTTQQPTKTRAEIAREECNRDPIFLLQIRKVHWVRDVDGYDTDGEVFWKSDPNDGEPDISDEIDDDWLIEHDYAFSTWYTESVFFTREEAESWAKAREYRWRKWRVYCVCAEGELAALLRRGESV